MWVMVFGVVALCQPWALILHSYGATIILAGLILFNIFSRIKPPKAQAVAIHRNTRPSTENKPSILTLADIDLIDVDKHFGTNWVIRKLQLRIKHGEFVVLLGPSGCGKTTTLRAIAGLEEIDSGEIRIDGERVESLPASRRDIAFVFQLYSLYPHMTAFENIAFPLRAFKTPNKEVLEKVTYGGQGAADRASTGQEAFRSGRRRSAAGDDRPRIGPPPKGDVNGRAHWCARCETAGRDAHRVTAPAY